MGQTQTAEPIERLLKEKEAAEMLGLNPGSMAVWRSTKKVNLPYIILTSGAIRYRLRDIEKFLHERTVGEDGVIPEGVKRHRGGVGRSPGCWSTGRKKAKATR